MDHKSHTHSLLKISFAKLERNSVKRNANPYTERYVNPLEVDTSHIMLASREFLLTDSDHDQNKQDKIEISTL